MKRSTMILAITIVGTILTSQLVHLGAVSAADTAVSTPTALTTTSCTGDNLLNNPGFEGQYSAYILPEPGHPDCGGTVCERAQMPDGWAPWWVDSPRPDPWINIMPEYTQSTTDQVNPDRVRSGEKSLHYFSFWSTHEGGAYQQVTAVPGGYYCFSVYGHAWSARTSTDWYSDPDPDNGELFQKVGIDPTGGTDWTSPNIIWSSEREQYDYFGLFEVEATAQAETITVFLYSRPNLPVKHNDVYWDDAALIHDMNLSVSPSEIIALSEDGRPEIVTYTVDINLSTGLTWTAALDPAGTLTPQLSATTGAASNDLLLTIDSTGFSAGSYTSTLTIQSESGVLGSPAAIPVTLWVIPEVQHVYLPIVRK